jgi:hypothetical protein
MLQGRFCEGHERALYDSDEEARPFPATIISFNIVASIRGTVTVKR